MAEDKKKKLGLQKNVSSIFKGVPIPQKNGGDKTRQTPDAPAPERSTNNPMPERTINNSFEPQSKSDIPEQEHVANIPELNTTTGITPESQRESDVPEPKHEVQIPAKPNFQEPQKPKISLIKKINQPTQLLRKDNPYKDLLIDENKKTVKPGLWQRIRDKLFAPKQGRSPGRQKATVLLIPILAFVFIFVLRQVFWTAPHKTEGAVHNDKPGITTKISTSNEIEWKIPALFPSSLRDPLKMIASGNKQGNEEEQREIIELNVNGILHSEDNPAVLIGDRIVHESEKISGVTIVKINKDSVEFEMNGKKWELSVRRQTADSNREVPIP